ncbi:hypothetical protein BEN47_11835 [Hymenobacter lapidarius]|uniref:Uncharacterized protein n=1 Tax=Hymenobacter lapidarius TaxID=1908237 RepID=A0A1G1T8G3_9BACT|nr:hypothetical protein [Hymenobacter lapidarius]OGX87160.1 hypothetical protein BEN47_11835 [Hymenobacter lapidarius]
MSKEYTLWKSELREALCRLRHIDFHLGHGDVGPESHGDNFREALGLLYTDGRFEQFFALRARQQAGLSEETEQKLQELKALLDGFDEPDTDAGIMADPQWHRILQKARAMDGLLAPN